VLELQRAAAARFRPEVYQDRNTVERGFGRLKQWRAIATRYDKYATTYLVGVLLVCMIIHHRTAISRHALDD
jgi:putative transposase